MQWHRRQVVGLALAAPFASTKLFAQVATRPLPGDTLGINTHLAQGQNPLRIVQALSLLGIRHIRDAAPTSAADARYRTVLQQGAQLTAITGAHLPLAQTIANLEGLELALPGALAAIEGPNEINNFPITYQNQTGLAAAMAFQTDLYHAVKASSVLRNIPVLAFTDYALRPCPSDFLNFHTYPAAGKPITVPLASDLRSVSAQGLTREPVQVTEFGYSTADVTPQQQATLLVDGWTQAVTAGVRRLFMYQLSDFYADPNPLKPLSANHFGLFTLQYQPKPAAYAIAQLMRS